MKKLVLLFLLAWGCTRAQQPGRKIGGPCEGCEAVFEYGNQQLLSTDTLPDFGRPGIRLKITGIIYGKNGRPAPGVILYIYHTNTRGIYEKQVGEQGWAKRHGHIRGWVKTGPNGRYVFYTLRPAAYPDRSEPQHIHPLVKEPGINPYYIDEYVFNDDPLLSAGKRKRLENRGGSGIVKPVKSQGFYLVERDIFLGRNIPGYD